MFDRLDVRNGDRHYIGRAGLSNPSHEPILTNWRTKAVRPLYEAAPSNHDDIVMRRYITLSFREVAGAEDEMLNVHSDQVGRASSAGTLTGEGALLAPLSLRHTGKMTDIVAIIQVEQDHTIRSGMNHAVVMQGGLGTGKTTVAPHRAAYLLHTHRHTLERSDMLVVGPSSASLHYIDQVLPPSGETGVISRTISGLIPDITATTVDSPYVAKLKGDRRMTSVVANVTAVCVCVPTAPPTVTISGIQISILAADIEQAQADMKCTRQPHSKVREIFIRSMLTSMQNRYAEQLNCTPDRAGLNYAVSLLHMNEQVRKTLNLCWLPMITPQLIDQLFARPKRLEFLAGWLVDNGIAALVRPKGSPLTHSDIPLLGEVMDMLDPDPKTVAHQSAADTRRTVGEQYTKDTPVTIGLGEDIVPSQMLLDQMNGSDAELVAQRAAADREWTYGYIVVDEAQELAVMD